MEGAVSDVELEKNITLQ